MAFMPQSKKKELAPNIKAVLKKYSMKGSISVNNHSTLVVTLRSGEIDFDSSHSVNPYWIDRHYSGVAKDFLLELKAAMNDGNHDRSDIMTDYFDVGWYSDINIGRWNKPYEFTGSAAIAA